MSKERYIVKQQCDPSVFPVGRYSNGVFDTETELFLEMETHAFEICKALNMPTGDTAND